MDKEFLEWWEANRLTFFEDDAMGLREIAAAAWVAGQDAPADGAGELVRAAEKLLSFRQVILAKEFHLFSPALTEALHDLVLAVAKIQQGSASEPSHPVN